MNWHEEALLPWPKQPPHRQLWKVTPSAYLRKGTNHASISGLLQRESVLGEQTYAPMRLGSGLQRLPSSHLALGSPYVQGGSGLPLAPWALLLGWWPPQLENNSKHLLLRGEG